MKLSEVVPWGRTLAEYEAMFRLSAEDMGKPMLGCGDGPASFNAEMTALGHKVVSIDPVYKFSPEEIRSRIERTYDTIISQVKRNKENYVWKNFPDADTLGRARMEAMEKFLADYEPGKAEGRYIAQSVAELDLGDRKFDLGLCSHFLFLYSELLSLELHHQSIEKLLSVCQEVRIFPLLKLDCTPSPHLAPVMQKLADQGFDAAIETVDYEFQKGGNQMLRIRHK